MARSGTVSAVKGSSILAPIFPANQLVSLIGSLIPMILALSSLKKTLCIAFGSVRRVWVWDDETGAKYAALHDIESDLTAGTKTAVYWENTPSVSKQLFASDDGMTEPTVTTLPITGLVGETMLGLVTPVKKTYTPSTFASAVENANAPLVGRTMYLVLTQTSREALIGVCDDTTAEAFETAMRSAGLVDGTDTDADAVLDIEAEAITVPISHEFLESGATI